MIVVFLFQPLFLNFTNHIFRVLSPHRPYQELNIVWHLTINVHRQLSLSCIHSENLSPSSKNSKVWQVLGGLFTHLPPTPNTRWPPKPPSWCTSRFKGGYPGLRPSPRVSLLDCKDDDVEERVALQAGLDVDQPGLQIHVTRLDFNFTDIFLELVFLFHEITRQQ